MATITLGQTPTGSPVQINLRMANRHGLIAGATGTGKTVTLQVLAEEFSRAGVPVFLADVKGDLSGLAAPGVMSDRLQTRLELLKLSSFEAQAASVIFWDLFRGRGHPLRTSVTEVGPLLLGRFLQLNEVQSAVLQIVFKVADDQGLLLLDLKDLRAMVAFVSEHAQTLQDQYGNIASASIAAIQRALLNLESAGGALFFGEPALEIKHILQHDLEGRGFVSILDATKLVHDGRLYATFLLWLLSELFEELEEVGDQDKPRLVFFFDEAHLLFSDSPPSLLQKIEQVVRLVRSKGVGVYFVTQNPMDIPEAVLGQLGNRVQHALRAFTPADQKAVRAAATTFRQNPNFAVADVITELKVGEALISVLDGEGAPTIVERATILPPRSRIGVLAEEERRVCIDRSPMKGIYDLEVDRESAFEVLRQRAATALSPASSEPAATTTASTSVRDLLFGTGRRQGAVEAMTKSAFRSVGSSMGRALVRGLLGALGGKRGR